MRFIQDSSSARNFIRSYLAGEIKINEELFRTAVIVAAQTIVPAPEVKDARELGAQHAAPVLALEPELVLLGTGVRQVFPPSEFSARFLRSGIGVEVMDTGAACRTFNVLVAEQRRVAALLLP
jgi:uncharacterized protein